MATKISSTRQPVSFPEIPTESLESCWGPNDCYEHLLFLPLEPFTENLTRNLPNNQPLDIANWYGDYRRSRRGKKGGKSDYRGRHTAPPKKKDGADFTYVANKDGQPKSKKKGRRAFQRVKAEKKHQRETRDERRQANKVVTGQSNFGGFARDRRNKWQKMKDQRWKARQQNRPENLYKFEPSLSQTGVWQQRDDELWLPDMKKTLTYQLTSESYSVETLLDMGRAHRVRKGLDKISVSRPISMKNTPTKKKIRMNTSDDPVMQKLAEKGDATVFITSQLMAVIMAMAESMRSFDFIVTKKDNGQIWFDLRTESSLHAPHPDENVIKHIVKDVNAERFMASISTEASKTELIFKEFAIDEKKKKTGPDGLGPHIPYDQHASTAMRYKRFQLSDYTVIARCHFDAYNSQGQPTMICCATQHDPRRSYQVPNWNEDLAVKFGAVKRSDMNNNFFRYRRWALEARLAGCSTVVLGYVSRQHAQLAESAKQVLKVETVTMKAFAKSYCHLNDLTNAWGILNSLITKFQMEEFEEGKYVVLRDPNKPKIQIYKVDGSEFEEKTHDVYGGFGR